MVLQVFSVYEGKVLGATHKQGTARLVPDFSLRVVEGSRAAFPALQSLMACGSVGKSIWALADDAALTFVHAEQASILDLLA
jgi:hypothetical protein